MRKTLLLSLAVILYAVAFAQFPKPGQPINAFSENLSRITQAFRNNFYSIQGEKLPGEEGMGTYRSTVSLPGALHSVIYRFNSTEDTTASWQAVMYTGEDYKAALKIYNNTCKLVDKTKVNLGGNAVAAYSGKIDAPDENLRFVSSVFRLNSKDAAYEKFYAEVEMVNVNYAEWEVRINLQSKKDDDEK